MKSIWLIFSSTYLSLLSRSLLPHLSFCDCLSCTVCLKITYSKVKTCKLLKSQKPKETNHCENPCKVSTYWNTEVSDFRWQRYWTIEVSNYRYVDYRYVGLTMPPGKPKKLPCFNRFQWQYQNPTCYSLISLKVGLSICFNHSSSKMMKNAFYFIIKTLFFARYLIFCLDFWVM